MEALTIIGGIVAFAAVVNGIVGVVLAFRKLDERRAGDASEAPISTHIHG